MDASEARAEVPVRYEMVSCCPKYFPCPRCGRRGWRKQKLKREVRTIAYGQIVYWLVRYAEYRAQCDCCKTFRSSPPGIDLKCHYDNRVRQAVLDRILEDGMSVQSVLAALKRDFLLDLSEGFIYDCLHGEAARLEMGDYRRWVLKQFSGSLCVDELHLGRWTLLLATDPLGDFPVAFALVGRNDQDHMRRFLKNLRNWGLSPEVIITDGSLLYPVLLTELWPQAQHQLCVFHLLQEITRDVLIAVKRLRGAMSRSGKRGRRRGRGRLSQETKERQKKRGRITLREKARFVREHRYLIVKRRERFRQDDHEHLETMFQYLPELGTLRSFMDEIYALFDTNQALDGAEARRKALVQSDSFASVPELAAALKMFTPEKFAKMMAFLDSPAGRKVRTNNHVERTNRKLRYYEKVRYKWRRRRNIVRFMILAIDRWWRKHPKRLANQLPQSPSQAKSNAKSTQNHSYALSA
jgi:transposase-like protein